MRFCVHDAWSPDDDALVNSHWVAERTAEALRRAIEGAVVAVVDGAAVDRDRVLAEFAKPHEGFVYCGHGREHVLYRELDDRRVPVPILDAEHVAHIGARWFHAFACLSGHTLCNDAANAGAGAYLGYRVTVNVSWEIKTLPKQLEDLLRDLVTVASVQLAQGQRSRGELRRRVRDASNLLLDWLDQHEEACEALSWIELAGLHSLASDLHARLELAGVSVTD